MSLSSNQYVTVIAILLLVATVPVLWQLADVRAQQAAQRQQPDLVDDVVSARQAPEDWDGDGVPDRTDECPTRQETTNGFQDGDGCPDVVATTGAS